MPRHQRRKVLIVLQVLATLLWVGLVLYPNPALLARSLHRTISPPLHGSSMHQLLEEAPVAANGKHSPRELELFVRERVPYQSDWITYRVPWYYPTPQEVLYHGAGDCKSRLVVFASMLEYLEIPYELRFSANHFWVHYEGKPDNRLESERVAIMTAGDEGMSFQIPDWQWEETYQALRQYFWDVMPGERKALLLTGFFVPSWLVRQKIGKRLVLAEDEFKKGLQAVDRHIENACYAGAQTLAKGGIGHDESPELQAAGWSPERTGTRRHSFPRWL